MKTYHAPETEPTPIFEAWVASAAGQVGLGVILSAVVLVALLLSLRWSGGSTDKPTQNTEPDPGPAVRGLAGDRHAQES